MDSPDTLKTNPQIAKIVKHLMFNHATDGFLVNIQDVFIETQFRLTAEAKKYEDALNELANQGILRRVVVGFQVTQAGEAWLWGEGEE